MDDGDAPAAAWTDIKAIHFKFQKHCNPDYPYAHELLNWTYSQLLQDDDLDDLFLDGSSRIALRTDVVTALRVKIIELCVPCATATTDKSLVADFVKRMPMRAKTAHGISLLRNASSVESSLKHARARKHETVVVYLDIDALHFRPTTSDGQFFHPKRFEDVGTTRFPASRLASAARVELESTLPRSGSGGSGGVRTYFSGAIPTVPKKFQRNRRSRRQYQHQQLSSSDHSRGTDDS